MAKEYLGDEVYADYNGYHLVLTVENGIGVTEKIYLEPEVYHAFTEYIERLKERSEAAQDK